MRCWHSPAAHAAEDCPAVAGPLSDGRGSEAGGAEGCGVGSGPAGREVELGVRSAALPLAQAGDELDELESRLEGRGRGITPPPVAIAPALRPIPIRPREGPLSDGRGAAGCGSDWWSDADLIETFRDAAELALRQGIEVVEVDRSALFELLLHVASLEAGLHWAEENGPCSGGPACSWHEGLWAAVEEVRG